MRIRYLVNPGVGRRFLFHGAFGTKAAARRKERQVGGFIRKSTIGGRPRYMVLTEKTRQPRGRRANPGRHLSSLEARTMARRRRSRRRGRATRRTRRAAARQYRRNEPNPRRRRRGARRARSRGRRYSRNPRLTRARGGFLGQLFGALVDGLTVTGGVVGQNAIVRYVPNVIPATVPAAAVLNTVLKDVLGILVGSWGAHQLFGHDTARMIVAGQASAAIQRPLRAANIPVVSTLMGEYDPLRVGGFGTYTPGVTRRALPPGVTAPALPAGSTPGNVRTLRNVGIYTEGIAFSPSLY